MPKTDSCLHLKDNAAHGVKYCSHYSVIRFLCSQRCHLMSISTNFTPDTNAALRKKECDLLGTNSLHYCCHYHGNYFLHCSRLPSDGWFTHHFIYVFFKLLFSTNFLLSIFSSSYTSPIYSSPFPCCVWLYLQHFTLRLWKSTRGRIRENPTDSVRCAHHNKINFKLWAAATVLQSFNNKKKKPLCQDYLSKHVFFLGYRIK